MDANARQRELETTKSNILVELRQLVYQCDQTMKAVGLKPFPLHFECKLANWLLNGEVSEEDLDKVLN